MNSNYLYVGAYIKCPAQYKTTLPKIRVTYVCSLNHTPGIATYCPICGERLEKRIEYLPAEKERDCLDIYDEDKGIDNYLNLVALSTEEESEYDIFIANSSKGLVFQIDMARGEYLEEAFTQLTNSGLMEQKINELKELMETLKIESLFTEFYKNYSIEFGIICDPEY